MIMNRNLRKKNTEDMTSASSVVAMALTGTMF